MAEWHEPEYEPTPHHDNSLIMFAIGCLFILAFAAVGAFALFFGASSFDLKSMLPSNPATLTQSSQTFQPTGRIVVNITGFTVEPLLGFVTIRGNVKNFSSKTYETVQLRFEFYDKNNNLVHTECRYIVFFERFRPGDVRAFAEQFFDLPKEARYVEASVETAQ